MKALAIDRRPGVGELRTSLRMMDLPVPEPGPGEVRVRIEAAAINVDDQHLAEGTMFGGVPVAPRPTPQRPWVPGVDLAGVVDAVGARAGAPARGVEVGQRVYGLRSPKLAGPWAEYGVAKAAYLAPLPQGYSAEQAASLCLGGMVTCSILAAVGDAGGKRVVVVGASGSIGTLLVPALARAGARVWGVCSGENRALVEGLGAERVLDYREAPFSEQVREPVDVVVDLVGGAAVEAQARAVTSPRGAFVTVVGPEPHVGERKLGVVGLGGMLGRIGWSWLRSRVSGPRYVFAGPLAPDFAAIDRFILAPGIVPTVDRVVDFEEAAVRDALAYVAGHRARGKVVIAMPRGAPQ